MSLNFSNENLIVIVLISIAIIFLSYDSLCSNKEKFISPPKLVCDAVKCGRFPEMCIDGTCLPVTTGGGCKTTGCGCIKGAAIKGSCKSRLPKVGSYGGNCISYNMTCPEGQRSDGVSCWEDVKTTCEPIKTDPCGIKTERKCMPGVSKCCLR